MAFGRNIYLGIMRVSGEVVRRVPASQPQEMKCAKSLFKANFKEKSLGTAGIRRGTSLKILLCEESKSKKQEE